MSALEGRIRNDWRSRMGVVGEGWVAALPRASRASRCASYPRPMRQEPVDYIARTRAQYSALGYPAYSWVDSETPPPFVRPKKTQKAWKVGLVASGGIYALGQPAFHFKDDLSFRAIPSDTPVERLRVTHFAYDLTDARRDPNVVLPLEPLRRRVAAGEVAAVGPHAYTFMGGIYSARKVRDVLAPAIADHLENDEVDVALMVPV